MTDLITRLRSKPYDLDKQEAADALEAMLWKPVDDEARNGESVWLYCPDIGEPVLARYCYPEEFMNEKEMEQHGIDENEDKDWFYADFLHGGRFEFDIASYMQTPLPPKDE